jgi:hypothetical protein
VVWHQGRFSDAARSLWRAVAGVLLQGTLPEAAGPRARALDAWLERVEDAVAHLPPHAQQELAKLMVLLLSAPGRRLFFGLEQPWHMASSEDMGRALQALRLSSLPARQQAYMALHDLAGAAWFAAPEHWGFLGYPGPARL